MLNYLSRILIIGILAATCSAFAATPQLGDILRNADGSIKYMTPYEARSACPTGTHLPTIRELAEVSQSFGAKGILETSEVNYNHIPPGYYLEKSRNYDGHDRSDDYFYFNNTGYQRPTGDLGNNCFWSSSSFAEDAYYTAFLEEDGSLYNYAPYVRFAVRCARGQ